jgi:hypothetical protein
MFIENLLPFRLEHDPEKEPAAGLARLRSSSSGAAAFATFGLAEPKQAKPAKAGGRLIRLSPRGRIERQAAETGA